MRTLVATALIALGSMSSPAWADHDDHGEHHDHGRHNGHRDYDEGRTRIEYRVYPNVNYTYRVAPRPYNYDYNYRRIAFEGGGPVLLDRWALARFDYNHDGWLNPHEYRESRRFFWNVSDLNRDGFVDRYEWRRFCAQYAEPAYVVRGRW